MRHILIILIGLLITVSCQKDFYLEDLLSTQELLANSRASHRDTAAALNELLDDANSEIAQLVDELTVVNAELMTSEEENTDLLEQVSGLTLDLEDLQGVADGLTSDIARLTADLDAELAQNVVDADEIADLTDELNDLQAVYDELVANPIVLVEEVVRTVIQTVTETVIEVQEVEVEVEILPTSDDLNVILSNHSLFTVELDGNVTVEGAGTFTVDLLENGTYDIVDPDSEFINVATYVDVLNYFIALIPAGDSTDSDDQTIEELKARIAELEESQVIITNDPYDTVSSTITIYRTGGVEENGGEGAYSDTIDTASSTVQHVTRTQVFRTVYSTPAVLEWTDTKYFIVVNGEVDPTPPELPEDTLTSVEITPADGRFEDRIVTSTVDNPAYVFVVDPPTPVATDPDTTAPATSVDLGPHTVTTAQRIFPGWSHIAVDEDLSDITGVTGVIVIIDGQDYNYRLDTSRAINPQWDGGVTNIHLNRSVDLDIPRGTVFTVEFVK